MTDDVNFGHLVKMGSARLLYCQVTIFLFPYFIFSLFLRFIYLFERQHAWEHAGGRGRGQGREREKF